MTLYGVAAGPMRSNATFPLPSSAKFTDSSAGASGGGGSGDIDSEPPDAIAAERRKRALMKWVRIRAPDSQCRMPFQYPRDRPGVRSGASAVSARQIRRAQYGSALLPHLC